MSREQRAQELGSESLNRAKENLTRRDDRRLIVDALTRLSPTQRAVIHLSFYLGCTTTQIAADLDMRDSMVKLTLHDGLQALANGFR